MKKFTKELTATGKNGTFTGTVELRYQCRRETKTVTQAVTHDEVLKTYDWSQAVGIYNGKEIFPSREVLGKAQLAEEGKLIEKTLQSYLNGLANNKQITSIEEDFSKLGYK